MHKLHAKLPPLSSLVVDLLATGALVRPIEATLRTQRAHYLVVPADSPPTVATTAFRNWILSEAKSIH